MYVSLADGLYSLLQQHPTCMATLNCTVPIMLDSEQIGVHVQWIFMCPGWAQSINSTGSGVHLDEAVDMMLQIWLQSLSGISYAASSPV